MKPTTQRGLRLGLTGGMGCGKSTAVGIFRELGFAVLDSDEIVRRLWDENEAVQQAAVARWGSRVFGRENQNNSQETAGQRISRRQAAEIVFADPKELEWAEGLLHPLVRVRWQGALAAEPQKDWVVEIPLLFEKDLASEFDSTICIYSSPALQQARLKARGLPPVEITARQARQWPVREKLERADFAVLNDGSLDFLRRQIVRLAGSLRQKLK